VNSAFDSCSKDMGFNSAEAGHCITTVDKSLTPIVPSGSEGRLNQLTPGIAGTFVVTLDKLFACVCLGLLSLQVPAGYMTG